MPGGSRDREATASLFFAAPPTPAEHLRRCLAWLSREERERCERFRFERDAGMFLLAHALVRGVLARCAGVAPGSLSFSVHEGGKPFVTPGTPGAGWHFNLSHTRGLVACLVSRAGPVGVDVEAIDTRRNIEGVAHRVLSPEEWREFDVHRGAARAERFFRYWTLKEAYIKALGVGLEQPLRSMSFTLGNDGSAVLGGTPDAQRWRLATQQPVAGYLISQALPATVPGTAVPQRFAWDSSRPDGPRPV